jgi:putative redox protein
MKESRMASRSVTADLDFSAPRYRAELRVGGHLLLTDEPAESGGADVGPAPTELLLTALGACTSITLRMYAERKQWPLRGIHVDLDYAERGPGKTVIARKIRLEGELDEAQRERLLQVANSCPVHKILTGSIEIPTELL